MPFMNDFSLSALNLAKNAKNASFETAKLSSQQKNDALNQMAQEFYLAEDAILQANQQDLNLAQTMPTSFLERLTFTPKHLEQMAKGVEQIAQLPDPVGEMTDFKTQASGIQVGKMRTPLGVLAIIYEARPNVTADAAALALKSGNAVILKGGSQALLTNTAIFQAIQKALKKTNIPLNAVQLVQSANRDFLNELIVLRNFIDVLIPRGGRNLVAYLLEHSKIPMIQHLDGNCHIYLEESAPIEQAVAIIENAKTQRYGTCNTLETLLIEEKALKTHLLPIVNMLCAHQVQIRACAKICALTSKAQPAVEEDFYTEFLAPILAIKAVANLDEAIAHINHYSSHHTESILSNHYEHIQRFLKEVHSSSVMVNASTRFADGFEYGLGAEIGISTDKIHARGPVGLEGLTSQKWIVLGNYHTRT